MAIITNRCIFYRIPKTGSTWVNLALRYSMRKNSDFIYRRPEVDCTETGCVNYYECLLAELLGVTRGHETPWRIDEKEKKGLFSFAFVREPVSWYKSFWLDRKAAQANCDKWKYFLLDFAWDPDINIFVSNALKMFPKGPVTTLYKCFLGKDGKMLDFVGKQENLREDLIKALTLAGEDFDENVIWKLKKANSRDSERKSLSISRHLAKKINMRESWVLNTFYK